MDPPPRVRPPGPPERGGSQKRDRTAQFLMTQNTKADGPAGAGVVGGCRPQSVPRQAAQMAARPRGSLGHAPIGTPYPEPMPWFALVCSQTDVSTVWALPHRIIRRIGARASSGGLLLSCLLLSWPICRLWGSPTGHPPLRKRHPSLPGARRGCPCPIVSSFEAGSVSAGDRASPQSHSEAAVSCR